MATVLSSEGNAKLASLPATFTTRTALKAGLHPRTLYRLREEGDIIELSLGVFRQADALAATWPDLLAVQARAPQAIAYCLTAASLHGLTDDLPGKVQIAFLTLLVGDAGAVVGFRLPLGYSVWLRSPCRGDGLLGMAAGCSLDGLTAD